jgi:pimeloyl-ACP methyl ester carboxylesterase
MISRYFTGRLLSRVPPGRSRAGALDTAQRFFRIDVEIGTGGSDQGHPTIEEMTMEKITSADGTTLAVDRVGSGPALVLVGGAFNDRDTVAGAAAALAGSYAAWTYDRRGRGESGPVGPWPGGEAGVAAEIADLAAVVDAAGGDAVLVGHSSGAQLVLEAVARGLPARRVVAYEPPYVVSGRTPAGTDLADRLATLPPAEATVLFLTEGVGVPAEVVEGMAGTPEFGFMQRTAHTLSYDSALGRVSTLAGLARITAPTLVLDGGASPDWMRAAAAAVAAAVPGATYRTVPGEDHAILRRPEVFAAEISRG